MRAGVSDLPLHGGRAPRWLFPRMVAMGTAIAELVVAEYGRDALLRRLADPFWFTALACTIGYDWDSSGVTTVTCAALKEGLGRADVGVAVAGGKGRASRRTPQELRTIAGAFDLGTAKGEALVRTSRLVAKVDGAAIQDRHRLYHHAFFVTEDGGWTVVQQGMNDATGYARRYQWYHGHVANPVQDPHDAVVGRREDDVLNLATRRSEETQKASVDLAAEDPKRLERLLRSLPSGDQRSLDAFAGRTEPTRYLRMPLRVNWEALRRTYEHPPAAYVDLLAVPGMGAATLRALAFVADLVYGVQASWQDPVKYAFAVGGKDGIPYPVDCRAMDEATTILREGVQAARVGRREKVAALRRLRALLPPTGGPSVAASPPTGP
jgi:hypothetical protein